MRNSPLLPRSVCVLGLLWISTAFPDDGLAAEAGRVFVKSRPSGARVFLDDETEARGKTPCIVRNVSPGTHVLRACLDGYADVTREIEVEAGAMARASLTFTTTSTDDSDEPDKPDKPDEKAGGGRVFVKSRPSRAEVFLDDETAPRGKTPCLVKDVPAGTHVLRACLDGYADVTQEIEVGAGALGRASLTFTTTTSADKPEDGAEGEPKATPTETEGEREPAGDAADTAEETTTRGPESGKPPKYVHVDCLVCRGTGLLQEMGCPTCNGTGLAGPGRCGDCGGTRRGEYNCPFCRGAGTLVRGGKQAECPKCKGKGKLACPLCRGKGKLKRKNPEHSGKPTIPCPYCQGSGFESNLRCLRCSGKGTFQSGELRGTVYFYVNATCPFCGGDGEGPSLCRRCRGAGVLSPKKNPVICAPCFGIGRQFRPCRACGGNGWIRSR